MEAFAITPVLAACWIPVLIAAGIAALISAGTAIHIAPDHPGCWQMALEDETADCPPTLKVRLCQFPEGMVAVR